MRGGVSVPKASRNSRKTRLRQALVDSLERTGRTENYWYDLVLDYLTFWEIKEKLKTEIERKGAMITIVNGTQKFRKRNDAVVELPKIHKRMTDILTILAIDEPPDEGEEGDDV